MSTEITMIVLLAAIFNASWNAIIKVSGDRVAVMAVITSPCSRYWCFYCFSYSGGLSGCTTSWLGARFYCPSVTAY